MIAIAVFTNGRGAPAPAAAVVLPPAAAPAPVIRPMPAAETILLSVSVSPSNAQVIVDDEAMPSNPFVTHFPKSFAVHRIRATAPGYQPRERVVSYADNVMLDLSLAPTAPARTASHDDTPRRREPPPARRVSPRAPAPVAAPAPAVVARPEPVTPPPVAAPPPEPERPRRRGRIDSTNPYKEEP
jgi:hypothetical protein